MSSEPRITPAACSGCGLLEFNISPRDKRMGQCFACGVQRRIEPTPNVVNDLMWAFYEVTHHALSATEQDAVTASLMERGIEAEVLRHSMVGVLPARFNTKPYFQEAIRTARTDVESLAASKSKGRTSKEYLAAKARAESFLETLQRLEEEVAKAVHEMPGGLVRFYTDIAHNVVGCEVSPPDHRDGDGLWIGASPSRRGLFNHGLSGPTRHSGLMSGADKLLIVEDWVSVLQIQSALYRAVTARGESGWRGYSWVTSMADSSDGDVVRAICRTPVFCYSPTLEGEARVEALRERVTLTAFAGPPDGTIGDAVVAVGDERGVVNLAREIAEAKLFTRLFRAVRDEVDGVRRSEGPNGLKKFEADRWASDIIGRDLGERGRLYHDGRLGYVLLLDTHEVIPFDPDNDECRLLVDRYGVSGRDTLVKPLLEHLDVRARKYGTKATVHASSHFDRERFACYVFNNAETVYRITPRGVDAVVNGTDDVLFVRDTKREPWTLTAGTREVDLAETLLGRVRLGDSALKPRAAWFLVLVWLFAIFFRSLFPTKVILALVGEKGSGKTSLLRRIGQLLFGSHFAVTDISNDPKDLDAAMTTQPFVVIDNADRSIAWLDDKLAIAATGGSIKRRVLYTTNKLAEYPIIAWVGITSRTPHFRREDVADRLLLVHVERFESFVSANHLDIDIKRHRDELMTEVVFTLQKIVAELQRQRDLQVETTFRMADFAEFAIKIGPVLGAQRAEVEQILRDLATVQLDFTSVDEPLLLHLDAWLATATNVARWVSTKELFEGLHARWAVSHSGTFPWRDIRQLGQQITSLRFTLESQYGYQEETRRGGTRWMRFNNRRDLDHPQAARGQGPGRPNLQLDDLDFEVYETEDGPADATESSPAPPVGASGTSGETVKRIDQWFA
jgi:hypothetical protein